MTLGPEAAVLASYVGNELQAVQQQLSELRTDTVDVIQEVGLETNDVTSSIEPAVQGEPGSSEPTDAA